MLLAPGRVRTAGGAHGRVDRAPGRLKELPTLRTCENRAQLRAGGPYRDLDALRELPYHDGETAAVVTRVHAGAPRGPEPRTRIGQIAQEV